MKNGLKSVLVIGLLVCSFLIFTNLVYAEESNYLRQGLDTAADQGGLKTSMTPVQATGKIVGVVLTFLGLFFLGIVLFAGMTMLTAGGRPEAIKKAKNLMIQGAIGLAVALMAWPLASAIIKKAGVVSAPSATVSTKTQAEIAECKALCAEKYRIAQSVCPITGTPDIQAECQVQANLEKDTCDRGCQ